MTLPSQGRLGIEGLLKQAREMTARAQELADKRGQLKVEGVSPDGMVAVTVDGQMKITSLRLDPRAMRLDSLTLGESVQAAIEAAYTAFEESTAALAAEMIGDDDLSSRARNGELSAEDVFRRFGVDVAGLQRRYGLGGNHA